jgi:hypothetical protein
MTILLFLDTILTQFSGLQTDLKDFKKFPTVLLKNNFILTHVGTFGSCLTAKAKTKANPKRAKIATALFQQSKFLLN